MEYVLLTGILIMAAYLDLRYGRISNTVVIWAYVISGICMMTSRDKLTVCNRICGLLLPLLFLFVLFVFGYFGAGDIKLCSIVGAFLGVKGVIYSFGIALVAATVEGGIKMIITGQWRWNSHSKVTVRFALPMLIGTVTYLLGMIGTGE